MSGLSSARRPYLDSPPFFTPETVYKPSAPFTLLARALGLVSIFNRYDDHLRVLEKNGNIVFLIPQVLKIPKICNLTNLHEIFTKIHSTPDYWVWAACFRDRY